jgi:ABC-type lipoprotein export system ATPase subunit
MNDHETIVRVDNVHKIYTRGSEKIDVLQGVSLEVPKGDFVALMGPSGSGKTTLLNLIGGLDRPTSGTPRGASSPAGARATSASSSSSTTCCRC